MSRRDLATQYLFEANNIVRNAVSMDKAGNYDGAKNSYNQAVAKFRLCMAQRECSDAMKAKAQEGITRCEKRISELEGLVPNTVVQHSSGGAAQAKRPGGGGGKPNRSSSNGGGGGGGAGGNANDEEKAEFQDRISSAILVEKPNIKWTDVAGLAEAKRALTEAVILPLRFKQFFVGERTPTLEQVGLHGVTQPPKVMLVGIPCLPVTHNKAVVVFVDAATHLPVMTLIFAQPVVTAITDVRLYLFKCKGCEHLWNKVHKHGILCPEHLYTFVGRKLVTLGVLAIWNFDAGVNRNNRV